VCFAAPGPRLKHRDKAIGRSRHIDPTAQMVSLLHRLSDIEDLHLLDLTAIDHCHFVLLSFAVDSFPLLSAHHSQRLESVDLQFMLDAF
jgi:hypothetical protein